MDEMVSALRSLHVTTESGANGRALLAAAAAGTIIELACAMPDCVCPDGRAYFEPLGTRSPWAPSADRWPVPGRDGGRYEAGNVRLSHRRCNTLAGTRVTQEHLRSNGYYGSDKHRETGRRLGLGRREGMREWWKTPEGQAVREANRHRFSERMAAKTWTPEEKAAAGQRLRDWWANNREAALSQTQENGAKGRAILAERRKDPAVHAALVEQGRKLGREHGVKALEAWRAGRPRSPRKTEHSDPAAVHAARVARGRELAATGAEALRRWNQTPEAAAIRAANGVRMAALNQERIANGYFRSEAWRASAAEGGRTQACKRWNVARGKPCTCGNHVGTAAMATG